MTCKSCRHYNPEPFATQCDGVTPVVGGPDRGVCMHLGSERGTVLNTFVCSAFSALSAVKPIVSVCMICQHVIGPDHRPAGAFILACSLVSHGVCLTCIPTYCAECGLTETETARVLRAATINTPIHGGASANQKPETVSTVSN